MKENSTKQTVVTFLNREQVDCLDKLGKDYFFKYGRKLSRSKILSELVNLLLKLGIDIEELRLDKNKGLWEGLAGIIRNAGLKGNLEEIREI